MKDSMKFALDRFIDTQLQTCFAHVLPESELALKNTERTRSDNAESDNPNNELYILTLSSPNNVVMSVLEFSIKNSGLMEVLKKNGINQESEKVYDFLQEYANHLGGLMKTGLNTAGLSVGISTPHRLPAKCIESLQQQEVTRIGARDVHYLNDRIFGMGFYLSHLEKFEENIDISLLKGSEPEASSEIELF